MFVEMKKKKSKLCKSKLNDKLPFVAKFCDSMKIIEIKPRNFITPFVLFQIDNRQ